MALAGSLFRMTLLTPALSQLTQQLPNPRRVIRRATHAARDRALLLPPMGTAHFGKVIWTGVTDQLGHSNTP